MKKHPILVSAILIVIIAALGLLIASMSLSLFTKHGQSKTVPKVTNISYTQAINLLDDAGFKVEISDSVFRPDVRPGYVVEQTPAANTNVKPGRVVYLIINAVSAQRVAIANMHGVSLRQAKSVLEGLGFRDIRVSYKLGAHKDVVLGIRVNGRIVRNGQKVPVTAPVVIEVSNGRVGELKDSLLNAELNANDEVNDYGESEYGSFEGGSSRVSSSESENSGESGDETDFNPYESEAGE